MLDVPVMRSFRAEPVATLSALDQSVGHEVMSTRHVRGIKIHALELYVTLLAAWRLAFLRQPVPERTDFAQKNLAVLLLVVLPESFPVAPRSVVLTECACQSGIAVREEMHVADVLLVKDERAVRTAEIDVTSVLVVARLQMALYLTPGEQQQSAVDALVSVAVVKLYVTAELLLAFEQQATERTGERIL